VIGNNIYYSFAGEGLIDEYETDYLDMKTRGTAEARRRRHRVRKTKVRQLWTRNLPNP
jgi:hypothetical protein